MMFRKEENGNLSHQDKTGGAGKKIRFFCIDANTQMVSYEDCNVKAR